MTQPALATGLPLFKPYVTRLYDGVERHYVWAAVTADHISYHETWSQALDELAERTSVAEATA
ncbi:hypothetical protein [Mycetocola reblochoni]|uniref:hypothetical protein n=1 Tax=Mycetocola reblochoni TaxID=331618 RepID=UPI003F9E6502